MTEQTAVNVEHLDSLVEAALIVHGARLDDGQREILREHVERLRTLAAQLDAYPLSNADEPDFSFQAVDRVDAI